VIVVAAIICALAVIGLLAMVYDTLGFGGIIALVMFLAVAWAAFYVLFHVVSA
jgi:hypothetical protein